MKKKTENIFKKATNMSFLAGYEGKWVFVVSGTVIEVGNSPQEVIEKIGENLNIKSRKRQFLFKVPTAQERLLVV